MTKLNEAGDQMGALAGEIATFIMQRGVGRVTPYDLRSHFRLTLRAAQGIIDRTSQAFGPGGKGYQWAVKQIQSVVGKANAFESEESPQLALTRGLIGSRTQLLDEVEYEGYTIKRNSRGNYVVTPPKGPAWSEEAATMATAKKWVQADKARPRGKYESVDEGVPEQHQRKIAVKTLSMSKAGAKIMGGMDHAGAVAVLRQAGWADAKIRAALAKAGHGADDIKQWVGESTDESMMKLSDEGDAKAEAKKRGAHYGWSTLSKGWYVGTPEQLKKIGVMKPLRESLDEAKLAQLTAKAKQHIADAKSGKLKGEKLIDKVGQEFTAYVGRQAIASALSRGDLEEMLREGGLNPKDFKNRGGATFHETIRSLGAPGVVEGVLAVDRVRHAKEMGREAPVVEVMDPRGKGVSGRSGPSDKDFERGTVVAHGTAGMKANYIEIDGTVWYVQGSTVVNRGPVAKFKADVAAGKIRAKLVEAAPMRPSDIIDGIVLQETKDWMQLQGDKILLLFKEATALHNTDMPAMVRSALSAKVKRLKKELESQGLTQEVKAVMKVAERKGSWEEAKKAIGESIAEDESSEVAQAYKDWMSRRAYIDNGGNYRLRPEGKTSGGGGTVAPWNKAVKKRFQKDGKHSNAEFSDAAKKHEKFDKSESDDKTDDLPAKVEADLKAKAKEMGAIKVSGKGPSVNATFDDKEKAQAFLKVAEKKGKAAMRRSGDEEYTVHIDEALDESKGTVKIAVKKRSGEWAACYYLNGKLDDGKTYYAGGDDREAKADAESTAKAMREEARKQGFTVQEDGPDDDPDGGLPSNVVPIGDGRYYYNGAIYEDLDAVMLDVVIMLSNPLDEAQPEIKGGTLIVWHGTGAGSGATQITNPDSAFYGLWKKGSSSGKRYMLERDGADKFALRGADGKTNTKRYTEAELRKLLQRGRISIGESLDEGRAPMAVQVAGIFDNGEWQHPRYTVNVTTNNGDVFTFGMFEAGTEPDALQTNPTAPNFTNPIKGAARRGPHMTEVTIEQLDPSLRKQLTSFVSDVDHWERELEFDEGKVDLAEYSRWAPGLYEATRRTLHGAELEAAARSGEVLVIGAGGLQRQATISLFPNTLYYIGASSSPEAILVTAVDKETYTYASYPYVKTRKGTLKYELGLIADGTRTRLKTYGKYMDAQEKATLEANLKGEKGPLNGKQKLADFQRVRVIIVGDGTPNRDAYSIAKSYGVAGAWYPEGKPGSQWPGKPYVEVDVQRNLVPQIQKEKGIEVVKVGRKAMESVEQLGEWITENALDEFVSGDLPAIRVVHPWIGAYQSEVSLLSAPEDLADDDEDDGLDAHGNIERVEEGSLRMERKPSSGSNEQFFVIFRDEQPVGYARKIKDTRTETFPWQCWRYKAPFKGDGTDDGEYLGATYLKSAAAKHLILNAVSTGKKLTEGAAPQGALGEAWADRVRERATELLAEAYADCENAKAAGNTWVVLSGPSRRPVYVRDEPEALQLASATSGAETMPISQYEAELAEIGESMCEPLDEAIKPTINGFHDYIVGALTQYDQQELRRSLKKRHGYHNPNALPLYFAALERAEKDKLMRGVKRDSAAPDDLKKYAKAIEDAFDPRMPPIKKSLKAIEDFIRTGKAPNYPGSSGKTSVQEAYEWLARERLLDLTLDETSAAKLLDTADTKLIGVLRKGLDKVSAAAKEAKRGQASMQRTLGVGDTTAKDQLAIVVKELEAYQRTIEQILAQARVAEGIDEANTVRTAEIAIVSTLLVTVGRWIPLTVIAAGSKELRGVNFGKIQLAAERLVRQGVIQMRTDPEQGDVLMMTKAGKGTAESILNETQTGSALITFGTPEKRDEAVSAIRKHKGPYACTVANCSERQLRVFWPEAATASADDMVERISSASENGLFKQLGLRYVSIDRVVVESLDEGETDEASTSITLHDQLVSLFTGNPSRAYSVEDVMRLYTVPRAEAMKTLAQLVTQGTLGFKRGEGYSLKGGSGIKLPGSSPHARIHSQRTHEAVDEAAPTELFAVMSPMGDKHEDTLIGLYANRKVAHEIAKHDHDTRMEWPLMKTKVLRITGAAIPKYMRLLAMGRGAVLTDLRETDETTTSGAVGGYRAGGLKQPENKGREGGIRDDGPGKKGPKAVFSPATLAKVAKQMREAMPEHADEPDEFFAAMLEGKAEIYGARDKQEKAAAKKAKAKKGEREMWDAHNKEASRKRNEAEDTSEGGLDVMVYPKRPGGPFIVEDPFGNIAEHPTRESAEAAGRSLAATESWGYLFLSGKVAVPESLDEGAADRFVALLKSDGWVNVHAIAQKLSAHPRDVRDALNRERKKGKVERNPDNSNEFRAAKPAESTDEAATKLKVKCGECGKVFSTNSDYPKCPKCKSADIDLAEGDVSFDPAQPATTVGEDKPWGLYRQRGSVYLWNSKTDEARKVANPPSHIGGKDAVAWAKKIAKVNESATDENAMTDNTRPVQLGPIERELLMVLRDERGKHSVEELIARSRKLQSLPYQDVVVAAHNLATLGLVGGNGRGIMMPFGESEDGDEGAVDEAGTSAVRIPVKNHDRVVEVGYEQGRFYYKSTSGAKHGPAIPPAKRKDHKFAETKFREMLRNEADVPNAEKLVNMIVASLAESDDALSSEETETLQFPESLLETYVLAAQAAGLDDDPRFIYESGQFTAEVPLTLAPRIRELVGAARAS